MQRRKNWRRGLLEVQMPLATALQKRRKDPRVRRRTNAKH